MTMTWRCADKAHNGPSSAPHQFHKCSGSHRTEYKARCGPLASPNLHFLAATRRKKAPRTTRGFEKVVRPEGLEPPTSWFVARRSIQLSYGRTLLSNIHHTGNIRVFQLPRTAKYGGEAGIRTLGEFPHTHLAGVRLQPLGHLSQKKPGGGRGTRTPMGFHPAVFKTAALPIRTSPPAIPNNPAIPDIPDIPDNCHQGPPTAQR